MSNHPLRFLNGMLRVCVDAMSDIDIRHLLLVGVVGLMKRVLSDSCSGAQMLDAWQDVSEDGYTICQQS